MPNGPNRREFVTGTAKRAIFSPDMAWLDSKCLFETFVVILKRQMKVVGVQLEVLLVA